MFYPTFFCSVTKIRHIVKDRYCYECGQTFNLNFDIKKKDLKNIKFKRKEEITCPKCKSLLEKSKNE
jgi:DNA-directed RNA polymerase subunit RPC12/RpoP